MDGEMRRRNRRKHNKKLHHQDDGAAPLRPGPGPGGGPQARRLQRRRPELAHAHPGAAGGRRRLLRPVPGLQPHLD